MEEEKKQQKETEVMEETESEEISAEIPAEDVLEDIQAEDTEISEGVVAEDEKEADILYLGIDLGTYRSAITASNGQKDHLLSIVGWPRDAVALRLLGKPILFGEEAMVNRLSLDFHRPLERGVCKQRTSKDRRAVRELVRHVIELVEPTSSDKVYGVIGGPARASAVNKQALVTAVSGLLTAVMVVPEPFTVAYGSGMLQHTLVVDIGAGTVDFCRVHGAMPTEDDLRTTYKAGDYIDEQLFQLVKERYENAQFTIEMIRKYKEEYSFVSEIEQDITVELLIAGKPVLCDITEEMRTACNSIVPEIMETIEELIVTADPEFQEALRNNIILAGGGSRITGLAALIERELANFGGGHITLIEDVIYAGADGALKLAMNLPEEYWQQLE